ncbi:phage scaffolding protein [Ilumatobacter coccineus]|uniref:Scaffolding protein n=1 Tax=Ilumatobacter coccineus (strain NBRC 103263 / KCTC 29153 / YM16-304) TaxID=1313172 RepID=A0A6C7EAD9_ILUCY|nr:hypothetical protein [Ilumatobacter coccineus]BAN03350.1 hypothetical protein YM304_30360 [Ilumatobacter coccineus YM16-304]
MKQRTPVARFVYDALPVALIPSTAARDEDADDEQSDTEGSDGADGAEGSSDEGDDDPHSDADDPDEDDPEVIGNPAAKRHAEDAKKQRLKAKEATERADELQRQLDAAPGIAAINEANQRADFFRLAATDVDDLDAAWKLADLSLISTDDSGTTTGVDAAVKQLKQSYPHLFGDPTDDARGRTTDVPGSKQGGSPSNGRRVNSSSTPRSQLDAKFPALARTRPR